MDRLVRIRPDDRPPPSPAFVCVGCRTTITPERWPSRSVQEAPPLCLSCIRHWGAGFGWNARAASHRERVKMQTLAALIKLIDWRVKNAKFEG